MAPEAQECPAELPPGAQMFTCFGRKASTAPAASADKAGKVVVEEEDASMRDRSVRDTSARIRSKRGPSFRDAAQEVLATSGVASSLRANSQRALAKLKSATAREVGLEDDRQMRTLLESPQLAPGKIDLDRLRPAVEANGVRWEDVRIAGARKSVEQALAGGEQYVSYDTFLQLIAPAAILIKTILEKGLVVPDWGDFTRRLGVLFDMVSPNETGAKADYIPILRDADADRFGVSVCTVDGQMWNRGHVDDYFSIQSTSKPITYAMAVTERSQEFVERYVGCEPSGRAFNSLELLHDSTNRPFNPMVNQGAIMSCGVVGCGHPKKDWRACVDHSMATWSRLSGNVAPVKFSQETWQSERDDADNNFALSYILKGKTGLPDCGEGPIDVIKMLDYYLGCCSIEVTCRAMSVVAATLANGGRCPITQEEVFTVDVVKATLTLMTTCGMYDGAGTFLLRTGLPAKSGVSGVLMTVIPNVMGLATFSPRLDRNGNSVRGVDFSEKLVELFSFHMFDNLCALSSGKLDPRRAEVNFRIGKLEKLRWGIVHGDKHALNFDDKLLKLMCAIAVADGHYNDDEINAILTAHKMVLEISLRRDQVIRELEAAMAASKTSGGAQHLGKIIEAANLQDIEAELCLSAMVLVAGADGHLDPSEASRILDLCRFMGLPETMARVRIAEILDDVTTESRRRSLQLPGGRVELPAAAGVADPVSEETDEVKALDGDSGSDRIAL